jgi:hypothetical protein
MHELKYRMRSAQNLADECAGDVCLRNIRYMLEKGFNIERSEHQIMFHAAFIEACLPKIYGDDWASQSSRVLKEFQIEHIRAEVLIMAMRRIGKSWAIAMFVLALLLFRPGIKVAIFSTGSRASSLLYEIMMTMLSERPEFFSRIVKNSTEHLFISAQPLPKGCSFNSPAAVRLRCAKDTAKLYAFPDGPGAGKSKYVYTRAHTHRQT